jgi:hypothetical protein
MKLEDHKTKKKKNMKICNAKNSRNKHHKGEEA